MRDDFCIFILTHRRADRVNTLRALSKCGYTGKAYLVIDDEDDQRAEYIRRYGDRVLEFSKAEEASRTDRMDNFEGLGTVVFARNACWALAERVGCRYFMQLDDDYTSFFLRMDARGSYAACVRIRNLNAVLEAMLEFFEGTPFVTVAMSQGGDHLGGENYAYNKTIMLVRKAMNSFLCSVDRPFRFRGRFNDDVNTYVMLSSLGYLFGTIQPLQLVQRATQTNAGGLTEAYLAFGTYVKSFYTVMGHPSGTRVDAIGGNGSVHARLHHKVFWRHVAPKILAPKWQRR